VFIYLLIIWRFYLSFTVSDIPIAFGPAGAKWVFYSWYIAGVLGLGINWYGLSGAEAGMITHSRWKPKDKMQLMLHADATWTGLSGWFQTGKWIVQMRLSGRKHTPGWLWFMLAVPSFVILVAWLLSCLCIEMASGFNHGAQRTAQVTGFVYDDFNASPGGRGPSRDSYLSARVPGFGAVYTSAKLDKSRIKFMQSVPVVLPNNEGVEELFLTAQGDSPIEGNAWGLLIHYDCKIVQNQSDLHLLKDRRSATGVWLRGVSTTPDPVPVEESPAKRQVFPIGYTPSPTDQPTQTGLDTLPKSSSTSESALASATPPPEPEDDMPPAYYFDSSFNVSYRSYPLHNNQTLVEVRKEPRGQWNGAMQSPGDTRVLNMDSVIETAYESWPVPISLKS
jgi:hypothetical protein